MIGALKPAKQTAEARGAIANTQVMNQSGALERFFLFIFIVTGARFCVILSMSEKNRKKI